MRNVMIVAMLTITIAGCLGEKDVSHPVKGQTTQPATILTASQPATQPTTAMPAPHDPMNIMAFVNGHPLFNVDLYELLISSQGAAVAQQLIASEVVRQAAEEKNISVTDEDIEKEYIHTIIRIFGNNPIEFQREQILNEFLRRKAMSRALWNVMIQRNAILRKLVAEDVVVKDEDVQNEFANRYGRKAVVRFLQTTSLATAENCLQRINSGIDFAAQAKKYSLHPSAGNGGLLEPITPNSSHVPPLIREIALGMTEPGEISGIIRIEATWYILRLEKIIEPQDVTLDDVRNKLTVVIRERVVQQMQGQKLRELVASADIKYLNPMLKRRLQANRLARGATAP